MFNVRLAGDHLYCKWLFHWLLLVMSMIVSYFVLSFFPREVLDEIWDWIESVSEIFATYLYFWGLAILKMLNTETRIDRTKFGNVTFILQPLSRYRCWLTVCLEGCPLPN